MGDGVAAFAPTQELFNAIMAYGVSSGGNIPEGLGVFSFYDLEQNQVIWYFSPEASFLGKAFNAEPCEKPVPKEGFGLLAGDQRSWTTHFPEYISQHRQCG
jgi:hypothetical protein